jgi:hypothetical protein
MTWEENKAELVAENRQLRSALDAAIAGLHRAQNTDKDRELHLLRTIVSCLRRRDYTADFVVNDADLSRAGVPLAVIKRLAEQ